MNALLRYQLFSIGYDGKLSELQEIALFDKVSKTYDKMEQNQEYLEKLVSGINKRKEKGYEHFKESYLHKLKLVEKKYHDLVMKLQPYYFFYTRNSDGRLVSISESIVGMLGYTPKEFINYYGDEFMYGLRCDLESRLLVSEYGYNRPYEMMVTDKDGETRYIEIIEFPVSDDKHMIDEIEGIVRDVTEHYNVKNKMSNMLYYDTLTGISNRLHLEVLMEKLLLDNYQTKEPFAVLFLDLDHFKHINDTLGHDVGDTLLQKITISIKESLSPHDIFARIGGDEFVILLRDIEEIDLTVKIHDLMDRIRQPWRVKGYELNVSVSIGVALYPEDGTTIIDLMKNADIAMYKSKAIGRDSFTFYEESFNTHIHDEMHLLQDMSDAIDSGEFFLLYQPKVHLANNEVISAEALIRWEHPTMGLIYPDRFIELAENTGLILKLGRWVIDEACRTIAWFNASVANKKFHLSINISIRQFQHEDMYTLLKEAVMKHGIDASQLSIEITESIMKENNQEISQQLNRIKSLNIGISLDDFGTGYSTLAYLDKLSIDELKIDKAFIHDIPENGEKSILVDTIITMGKTLDMTIVAEGVEYEYQREYLAKKSCDLYQGFLFSKPVSRSECFKHFSASG
jgi:diguanylate cyclase (GGDEF)-like protein/PAS domain S-box-containing protein